MADLYLNLIEMRKPKSFRHPVDVRYDERVAALIGEHGALGYGIYWMIVEMICKEPELWVEYSPKMIRRMAAVTGQDYMKFNDLLDDLIFQYDLLDIVEGHHLVSTIAYRKPRRQHTGTIADTTATPPHETTGDSTQTSGETGTAPGEVAAHQTDTIANTEPTEKMSAHVAATQQPDGSRATGAEQPAGRQPATEQQASSRQPASQQQANSRQATSHQQPIRLLNKQETDAMPVLNRFSGPFTSACSPVALQLDSPPASLSQKP